MPMTKKYQKIIPRIMIACKINLQNFEDIMVSVQGNSKEECLTIITDVLNSLGKNSEVTKEQIQAYKRRVIE
jgi:mannitol/fructose-specific phosphotransferase system IIA component (Ntr-type)